MSNSNFVIQSVVKSVQRTHVVYFGELPSSTIDALTHVKTLEEGGYQRPRSAKRVRQYRDYLLTAEAVITPVILNGDGQWHFQSDDGNVGELICDGRASVIDGQHRLGGLALFTRESGESLPVPFLCYENLSFDEEVSVFDKINSEQVGLPKSIIAYLRRDQDENDGIAFALAENSAFTGIVSTNGQRKAGSIQLATLSTIVNTLFDSQLTAISKDTKVLLARSYWKVVKEMWSQEWNDHKTYKLRSTLGWVSLSIVGRNILSECFKLAEGKLDTTLMKNMLRTIKDFDWSADNQQLQYFGSGIPGGQKLGKEFLKMIYSEVITQ